MTVQKRFCVKKEYAFPGAVIKVFSDGSVVEYPKFCLSIKVPRSRRYAAEALLALRQIKRASKTVGFSSS